MQIIRFKKYIIFFFFKKEYCNTIDINVKSNINVIDLIYLVVIVTSEENNTSIKW